jgi:phenylacetate-CoA ligase
MKPTDLDLPVYSTLPGATWPAIPPAAGQAMLAAQFQFDRSQWWPADQMRAQQFRQLRNLIAHATANVPHYREHLARTGVSTTEDINPETFLRWPVLDKRELQAGAAAFEAASMPAGHGEWRLVTTSGSTGEPLRAATTDAAIFVQHALVLRSQLWYGMDFRRKHAFLSMSGQPGCFTHWGPPANAVFRTGPSALSRATDDFGAQLDWICSEEPAYLKAHAFTIRAVLEDSRRSGNVPQGIKAIIAYGEMLPHGTRELARDLWNAGLYDVYSASEIGSIAFQCPDHTGLHVQNEHVYVEVLNDDGSPCAPGESGRVIVTDLHNFAMPLIRYDLRDHARLAGPCPCGRGLPVIEEILGRSGQVALDPTGRRFLGHLNLGFWTTVAPIMQKQVVQHTPSRLEVRYVAQRPLSTDEQAEITRHIRVAMRYDYEIAFTQVARIARNAGGKFDEFVSMAPPAGA